MLGRFCDWTRWCYDQTWGELSEGVEKDYPDGFWEEVRKSGGREQSFGKNWRVRYYDHHNHFDAKYRGDAGNGHGEGSSVLKAQAGLDIVENF